MKKRPKLTHTKLPMMFITNQSYNFDARYRIIYPDGSCQWQNAEYLTYKENDDEMLSPCWATQANYPVKGKNRDEFYGKCKSAREAIKLMKKYDKEQGYKSIFLGYIK